MVIHQTSRDVGWPSGMTFAKAMGKARLLIELHVPGPREESSEGKHKNGSHIIKVNAFHTQNAVFKHKFSNINNVGSIKSQLHLEINMTTEVNNILNKVLRCIEVD